MAEISQVEAVPKDVNLGANRDGKSFQTREATMTTANLRVGKVQSGPYQGQTYQIIGWSNFPRWQKVRLFDGEREAIRDVRESELECSR